MTTELLKLQALDNALKTHFDVLSKKQELNWDTFWHRAGEIIQLKTKIKARFAKSSTFIFDDDESNAKVILQKINSGKLFFADLAVQSLETTTGERLDLNSLDGEELDNLASDELYSWFDPSDYIERLIEIGALVIDIYIPRELEFLIQETSRCYAFEQYIAVYSLCRTILDSSMRDICLRIGEIKKIENTEKFYKKHPPADLIRRLSKDNTDLKKRIKDLYYDRLSPIVHGLKVSDSNGVQSAFKETILMVQELYEDKV